MTSNSTTFETARGVFLAAIVALSVVAASAAFAGTAVADEHDITVDVADADVSVGETFEVEVTLAEAAAAETAGGNLVLEYDDSVLEFEGAEIDDGTWDAAATVNGEEPGELSILAQSLEGTSLPATQATLTFTAVAEGESDIAAVDTDYTTADLTSQNVEVDAGTVSVDGSWWASYVDDEGVVDTPGLQTAIGDWSGGELDTGQLQELISSWSSGQPMDEPSG